MDSPVADHRHLVDAVSTILPVFSIAGLVVPLLQRIKLSPVLGYLLCGIIIGPYGLSQLSDSYPWISYITIAERSKVHMLGELGIITLMFMIGLELSFDRLKQLRLYIFGLGTAQIVVTAVVIFIIAKLFDNTLQASVLIGASFALSSTAIVMKLLEERKLVNEPIGILCFSILLMQDLAVIPILVLASSFTGDMGTSIVFELSKSLLFGVVTVVAIYWLGKKVMAPLLKSISFSTSPEWLGAFIVFIVLICSLLTYAAGMSLALGAFLVGLLIAETEFRHEVEVIISPIKGLLMGIFFLSIGMMINLHEVMGHPFLLTLSVLGIFIIKGVIILLLSLGFRVPARLASEASVYLAQPGEFALLILGLAMARQLVPASDVQFFLLVTVLAMMVTPLLFKLAPIVGQYGHRLFGTEEAHDAFTEKAEQHRVVIAGFGRVGQLIAKQMQEQRIPYVAFDLDGKRVQRLKKRGFNVIYGDARKRQFWQLLIGAQIEAAVIAIDDHKATVNILKSLRSQFPLLPVIVRAKDIEDSDDLYEVDATHVVAETQESSLRIAQLLLDKINT